VDPSLVASQTDQLVSIATQYLFSSGNMLKSGSRDASHRLIFERSLDIIKGYIDGFETRWGQWARRLGMASVEPHQKPKPDIAINIQHPSQVKINSALFFFCFFPS